MDMRYQEERHDWIEREVSALQGRLRSIAYKSPRGGYSLKVYNELDAKFAPALTAWRADKDDKAKSRALLLIVAEFNEHLAPDLRQMMNYYCPAPKEAAA